MPRQCARSNRVTHLSATLAVAVTAACSPAQYYIETSPSGDGGQTNDSSDGGFVPAHRGGSTQTNSTAKNSSFGGNSHTGGFSASMDTQMGGSSSTPESSNSGGSAPGGTQPPTIATDPSLVLRYPFDETAGALLTDASGNGRNGKIVTTGTGTTIFSTQSRVGSGALLLNGENANDGAYVEVPMSLQAMGATTEVTFSCWVYVNVAQAWQRIFEFGSNSSDAYLFLTVQQASSKPNSPRFAITTSGKSAEQSIDMTTPAALTTGQWHHLVVVLGSGSPYIGTLYIDNQVVGTNSNMTLRPSALKYTSNNWLGRSEFSADYLYSGLLDDFRIYARALTATEIAALYAER